MGMAIFKGFHHFGGRFGVQIMSPQLAFLFPNQILDSVVWEHHFLCDKLEGNDCLVSYYGTDFNIAVLNKDLHF
jgi:hypothetical protein